MRNSLEIDEDEYDDGTGNITYSVRIEKTIEFKSEAERQRFLKNFSESQAFLDLATLGTKR